MQLQNVVAKRCKPKPERTRMPNTAAEATPDRAGSHVNAEQRPFSCLDTDGTVTYSPERLVALGRELLPFEVPTDDLVLE